MDRAQGCVYCRYRPKQAIYNLLILQFQTIANQSSLEFIPLECQYNIRSYYLTILAKRSTRDCPLHQPCQKCFRYGHDVISCPRKVCLNCKTPGHIECAKVIKMESLLKKLAWHCNN